MKAFFRASIAAFLRLCARRKLAQIRPRIIAITGSVGKTSTKEAIFTVLSSKYSSKRTVNNFNTEFGVPLTILNQHAAGTSFFSWLCICARCFAELFHHEEHRFLILEMGIDAPGDMDALLKIARPHVAVMTRVIEAHMDPGQFANAGDIFNEKKKIVFELHDHGIAILNRDDELISGLDTDYSGQKIWYGKTPAADLYVNYVDQDARGLSGEIVFHGQHVKFSFDILGKHHMSVLLPAIACGLLHDMTLAECVAALRHFSLPPGRMNLLRGIRGSSIIDSSYNASPASTSAALQVLSEVGNGARKIAVLGSMNELGPISDREHRHIGQIVSRYADILVTVGSSARLIAEEAGLRGIPTEHIATFEVPEEAADYLRDRILEGDIILVKGSQNNVRLEKLVKKIMAEPERAAELLVRQGPAWLD